MRMGVNSLAAAGRTIGRGSAWVVGETSEGARTPFVARLPTLGASDRPFVESFEFPEKGWG